MNEQLVNTKVTEKKQNKKSEECVELKNIKYQTMLINNSNSSPQVVKENIENIDNFLTMEKQHNQKQPWCKLGDGTKIRKLHEYINELCAKNKDNEDRKKKVKSIFKKMFGKKKTSKSKRCSV